MVKAKGSRRVGAIVSLAIGIATVIFMACSAEFEDVTALEEANDGATAPLETKFGMELTADERARLEAHFAANGMPEGSVTYSGRVVVVEGDIIMDADLVLSGLDSRVEKGQTLQFTNDGAGSLSRCTTAHTPASIVDCPTGTYQFWRPWIDGPYQVIVNRPEQYHFDLVLAAANRVENIVGDAVGTNLFNVVKASEFNPSTHLGPRIQVNYFGSGSLACNSTTALACAEWPRITTEFFMNFVMGQETKMRLGRELRIVSSKITANNEDNRGVLTHEFLHLIGIGHNDVEGGSAALKYYVPGTAKVSPDNPLSIMKAIKCNPAVATCRWRSTPQADDIDTMQTLFPPGASAYVHAFSTVNAN